MAKKIMTSSHELYKKLSEYHEFERRLVAMLNEKNLQINKTNNTQQHTQDILTLHQRLGRCRQAISKVEREIEINEKSF